MTPSRIGLWISGAAFVTCATLAGAWMLRGPATVPPTTPAAVHTVAVSDPNEPIWKMCGSTAVCFAPGTSDEYMRTISSQLYGGDGAEFFTANRWPGTTGSPVTLSWSVVPDGVNVPGLSGGSVASNMFAQMNAKFSGQGGQAQWISLIGQCFGRWQAVGGVNYSMVHVAGVDWDDGAAWGTAGSPNFRGDTRIGGRSLDGQFGVLAFATFPPPSGAADIVVDMQENWGASFNNWVFFRNTLTHEIGHTLGFQHVCPSIATKLMEPFESDSYDTVRHDDIRGLHSMYGDRFENNDSIATASNVGTINVGTPLIIGTVPGAAVPQGSIVSIDQTGGGDPDYYRFTTTGPRALTATVTPVGLSYDSSPQNGDGSCASGAFVNSLTLGNLAIQVISTDGVTVLATAQSAPVGQSETVSNVLLNAPGNYYIRIFTTNNPPSPQLYTVSMSVTNQDCNNNGQTDPQDIALGISQDCNSNLVPDECEVAPICPTCPDCNNDHIPDSCQVPPVCPACLDCNSDFVPDACQPDCNSNSRPDDCDITLGAADCQPDGIPDICQVPPLGSGGDCNQNTVPDSCEVANGQQPDCNGDTIPDICNVVPAFCGGSCLPDCDSNLIPDVCDLSGVVDSSSAQLSPITFVSPQSYQLTPAPPALGPVLLSFKARGDFAFDNPLDPSMAEDVQIKINGTTVGWVYDGQTPGESHFDCPGFDDIDTLTVPAATYNALVNGIATIQMVPTNLVDPCPSSFIQVHIQYAKRANDCNFNSIIDFCETASGQTPDCNFNHLPDSCDITSGLLTDFNANLIPDQCECVPTFCRGDLDDTNRIDGDDVLLFTYCYMGHDMTIPPCACADLNSDGSLNAADLALFIDKLLGRTDPNPACP